jgi:A/G-specific adenine glycosylase
VLDGNVYRILSRFYGDYTPIDTTEGKKKYALLAQQLLVKNNAALYNQAIMDFGATVCKPKLALCNQCVLNEKCIAFNLNTVNDLPIKEKKLTIKKRNLLYAIIKCKEKVLVHKRTEIGVWNNLYEFVLFELPIPEKINMLNLKKYLINIGINENFTIKNTSNIYSQKLTHQHIQCWFLQVNTENSFALNSYKWVNHTQFKKLPFSGIINDFLQNDKNRFIFDT